MFTLAVVTVLAVPTHVRAGAEPPTFNLPVPANATMIMPFRPLDLTLSGQTSSWLEITEDRAGELSTLLPRHPGNWQLRLVGESAQFVASLDVDMTDATNIRAVLQAKPKPGVTTATSETFASITIRPADSSRWRVTATSNGRSVTRLVQAGGDPLCTAYQIIDSAATVATCALSWTGSGRIVCLAKQYVLSYPLQFFFCEYTGPAPLNTVRAFLDRLECYYNSCYISGHMSAFDPNTGPYYQRSWYEVTFNIDPHGSRFAVENGDMSFVFFNPGPVLGIPEEYHTHANIPGVAPAVDDCMFWVWGEVEYLYRDGGNSRLYWVASEPYGTLGPTVNC